jgi:hypothetical protein
MSPHGPRTHLFASFSLFRFNFSIVSPTSLSPSIVSPTISCHSFFCHSRVGGNPFISILGVGGEPGARGSVASEVGLGRSSRTLRSTSINSFALGALAVFVHWLRSFSLESKFNHPFHLSPFHLSAVLLCHSCVGGNPFGSIFQVGGGTARGSVSLGVVFGFVGVRFAR